ncbi:type VI secretion system baseplate subunit TssG [Salmonella enterica]|nr:type VI secretion system baseplate subunit TssG [Salmonella enterica]
MARESQPARTGLTLTLNKDIWRANFYRFCQLLEQENPDSPKLGTTSHPGDDPVRFCPWPGMGFPVSTLKAVETNEDHPTLPPTVRTTFLGMYGVDSPLPTPWLDDIAQRREGHEVVTAFLDIFSHRITTQYYRIWRKYAYPATFEAGGRDATSQCLLGLVGLGIPGTAEQVATPVSRFLALLSTMRLPTRNAEGFRALVSLLAPNTRAIITEPDPVKVHIDNRSGLGAGNRILLSQRATLGKTAKEACSRVLVTLETEDPDETEGWLPGGVLHTDLLVLLRVYLGYRSDARLRLTVPVRLLPEPRLGKGRRIQLGRTGLLGLKAGKLSNSRESLTVSLGCYEGLQWSVLPPAEDGHYRFD